jgi:hypothetical protein
LFESNRVSTASFQIKPEKVNRKELEKEEKAAGITSAQVQKTAHGPAYTPSRIGILSFLFSSLTSGTRASAPTSSSMSVQ